MTRSLLWIASLFWFLAPAVASAQQYQEPYYGHHMWGGGWGGWFLGPIMMILVIAVAVAVVVLVVRWLGGSGHGHGHGLGHGPGGMMHNASGKAPMDILKERFARGEIDKEEFEERRRILDE